MNNVAVRFVNSVIVMSFILHPVVVRPGWKNHIGKFALGVLAL